MTEFNRNKTDRLDQENSTRVTDYESVVNLDTDKAKEDDVERCRKSLIAIREERRIKRQVFWRRKSKLWPYKALLLKLYEQGHGPSELAELLKRDFNIRVDRSTVSRQLKAWLKRP